MNILFFGSKDGGMFCFQTTLDCLEFFYPRMSHGGIILCTCSISCGSTHPHLRSFAFICG